MLLWIARFLQFNAARARAHVAPHTVASDGAVLNLCAALLKLCIPFSKLKKAKASPSPSLSSAAAAAAAAAATASGVGVRSLADDVDPKFLVGGSPAYPRDVERLASRPSVENGSDGAGAAAEDAVSGGDDGDDGDDDDDDDDLYDDDDDDDDGGENSEEAAALAKALAASLQPTRPEDSVRSMDSPEFSAVSQFFFYAARAQHLSVGTMLRRHGLLRRHISQLYHQTRQVRALSACVRVCVRARVGTTTFTPGT